jgi:hypothetical protein
MFLIGLGVIESPGGASAAGEDRSLLLLLPTRDEVWPWAPDSPAQLAEGQDLFSLINGGAELFLRHGFERAAVQSYNHTADRHIQVEIYRMATPDGATEVFRRRIGAGGLPLIIGDAGLSGDYYVVFRRDRCLVTVAAGEVTDDAKAMVLHMARAVERRAPAACR